MKHILFFYSFCFLFVLCSCSSHKKKYPIDILNHQDIDLSEDFIGYGGFLSFYQGSIVGLDLSSSLPPFFCITPNRSSQILLRFGNRGQGPDDFLMPSSIQHINNQTIGVFDMNLGTYNEFRIPNEHEVLKIDKKIHFQTRLYQIIKTAYNQYIGLSFEKEMFLLSDSTGTPISTFFEYPYKDNDELQFVSRSPAYQGTITTNPSKNKFVYSSFHGDIIHFYSIENNNIKPIIKRENEYPIYRKRGDNYDGVIFNPETKIGYIATYATDKFVYAIFSGINIFEQKSANFEGLMLHIFDWKGTLLKEYQLDALCSYLCVSDDDSKIWAIVSKPDITLVSFDLEKHNYKTNTVHDAKITSDFATISDSSSIHDSNIMYDIKKMSDIKNSPSIGGAKSLVYEITKDGASDEEMQKIGDSIKHQLMNGNKISLDKNADIKYDTISENLIKIRIKLK